MRLPISEFWRSILATSSWLIAAAWCWRAFDTVQLLPGITDLTAVEWDRQPAHQPSLVVVVPARDEAEKITATIDSLLLADYEPMLVLAVDDRSTDGTGPLLDDLVTHYSQTRPGRLGAIHIQELPEGWLGKTFALTAATENSSSDYLLFTDADVLFSPSILRRAVVFAEESGADHLVVLPTPQVRARGEGMMLGVLQVVGLWAARPWRVHLPRSRDAVGVGAFNLLRRDALLKLGGLGPQRLAVLEDVTLGRRIKAAGLQQRVAFAPGLVLIHWAKGARGIIRVMTKNLFATVNFRPALLLLAIVWLVLFWLLPLLGLLWWNTLLPSLLVMIAIGAMYKAMGEWTGVDARYALLYPAGVVAFVYAMLRSMTLAFVRRGVLWRGTFYPLRDLRRHNSPFQWTRMARRTRNQKMQDDLLRRAEEAARDKQAAAD